MESLERATTTTLATLPALPRDVNPARRYLRSLRAASSRATMAIALATVATVLRDDQKPESDLTQDVIDELLDSTRWDAITADQGAALHARLCELYSAGTVNKLQAALRGTLKEAQAVVRSAARDARKDATVEDAMRIAIMSQDRQDELADAIRNLKTVPPERAGDDDKAEGHEVPLGDIRAMAEVCARDETVAGARNAAMLAVAYVGGLRRAEIVNLDIEHFDQAESVLTVRGKGNRVRRVPIYNGARMALDAWINLRGNYPGPLFVPINKGNDIQCTIDEKGEIHFERLTPQSWRYILRSLAQAAGVKPVPMPHDLRRTFIGNVLDTGSDLVTAQKLAGHADPKTTASYDRRGKRAKVEAVKRLSFPYFAPGEVD